MLPVEQKKSVCNVVDGKTADCIAILPDEYLEMSEEELVIALAKENKRYTLQDHRLRISFWTEYARSVASGERMKMANVYFGIVSHVRFYGKFLHDPARLAYMLMPPRNYEVMLGEALDYGWNAIREMMEELRKQFIETKEIKYFNAFKQTVETLDLRVHGPVPMRIEQRNLNVNINKDDKPKPLSAQEIERELIEMRKRVRTEISTSVTDGERTESEPNDAGIGSITTTS